MLFPPTLTPRKNICEDSFSSITDLIVFNNKHLQTFPKPPVKCPYCYRSRCPLSGLCGLHCNSLTVSLKPALRHAHSTQGEVWLTSTSFHDHSCCLGCSSFATAFSGLAHITSVRSSLEWTTLRESAVILAPYQFLPEPSTMI